MKALSDPVLYFTHEKKNNKINNVFPYNKDPSQKMDQIEWQIVNMKNVGADNSKTKSVLERHTNEKVKIIIKTMAVIQAILSGLSLRSMKGW